MVLCFGLCIVLTKPAPLRAQEHPTAPELFDQGMQQYADGDLAAAQKTFRRLDPLQLNKEQRLIMYETIQNIDRQLRQDTDPAKVLEQAIGAQRRGKLPEAMNLYQTVTQHPRATEAQKEKASARLADVKRRINAELTRARQSIDKAAADIRQGRYEAAERKLRAVKESGLDLGWFENERVDRQLIIIAERTSGTAQQQPPVSPVERPVSPIADSDNQEQALLEELIVHPGQDPKAPSPPQTPAWDDQLAERERQLAQREQRLAQLEEAQRLQKQQLQAQRQQELQEERRLKAQQEKQLAQQRAERARELAQRQQQLAARERQLAEKEEAHRVEAQRLLARARQEQEQPNRQTDPSPQPPTQQAPPQAPARPVQHVEPVQEPPIDILSQARLLHAQEKMIRARNAQQANHHHLAAKLYQEVLELDPDNQGAKDALALVQTQLGSGMSPRGVLEAEMQARTIRANAAIAEFQELMSRAVNLLEDEAFAAAHDSVQQAKITLDLNQRFLPTTRYRSLRDNAVNLAARIADAERTIQEAQKRELEVARRTEAEKRRAVALLAQQQETQRLLRRAADLRREQKYQQAMELLNQALFLDPNNVAAQAMKEMIEDSQLFVNARNQMRQRNLLVARQSSANIDASTPFADLMTYPPDWPQLTASRLSGIDPSTAESEINRRVALKLRDSVPIDFEANKLVNIIEYLRNTTGVNFFVNWPVLETIGIDKDLPVTLQLTNVPVDQALRLVLQQASATNDQDPVGFSIIEGVVTISTDRDLAKTTDIRPYDIRDLLVQVPNFTDAPEFDLNAALANTNSGGSNPTGGGSGGGGGGGGLFGDAETEEEEPTREQLIEQIIGLIQDTVGVQDDWEVQGGVGSIRELNGNLIVKTTPKNHRQIAQLMAQLRETRAIQIAIEGRFLIVDQNFLDEIGVDLDIQLGTGSSKWGPVLIGQDTSGLVPRAGTGVPGSFGRVETTGGIGSAMSGFGGSPTDPRLGAGTTSGGGFTPSGRSFDFGISYLDDLQVNLMISATQASRRAISLTAPRVTLFNGQRAFVVVARQTSFISDLEPVPDSAGFDPTLSVTQSGVILDVEATVSADRRYVTMTVRPSLSTLIDTRRIDQTVLADVTVTGEDDDGNQTTILVPLNAFIEAPEVELTSVKTSVSVPDRGTLLIGGQRIVADIEVEAGVPVLSKIPVLNRLFTSTSTIKDERTLLILIKPTIIIQSEEEELNFPGLLQNPKKFGVGHRF